MTFTCLTTQTKRNFNWGLFVSIAFFAITMLFTSCDSFLESKTVKQEIEQHISYANAPSYKILVQANDEDGTLKKPITGELTPKVTDTFEIKFAPAQDHEFVRWEVSSVELPEGESIYDYISFEDAASPETKVTFKKALNSIVITAFCPSLPYVTFLLTGSRYGKFTPLKGTYTCIQSYSYPLSFDPDTDYEFVRWQIYDSKTGTEIPNGTYIKIDNPTESSTTYSLTAVPLNSEISLAIKPVITERPQILSRSPVDYGDSFYRDSRIQVLFDHDMDESCIYYTQEELDDLIAEKTADSGLFPEQRNGDTVYFGYEKDGITYFKNILIKDYESNENLNECFDHPYFDTPSLLMIPANRNPVVPKFALVHVSMEKGLSYTVNGKSVNMPKSEKWLYQVSGSIDTDPPTLTSNPVKDSAENELSKTYTDPWKLSNYSNGLKVKLNFGLNDPGSGPASKFVIERKKVFDKNYDACTNSSTESIYINFQTVSTKTASYENEYTLPSIPESEYGVYSLRLVFYDKSNNPVYYPAEDKYYYYNLDKTPPVISNLTHDSTGTSIKLSWESSSKDYKETSVYYKTASASSYSNKTTTSKNIEITGLTGGTTYNIIWFTKIITAMQQNLKSSLKKYSPR